LRWLAVALIATGASAANTVSDEVFVNVTQSSDTNPRSGNLGDALNASFELSPAWSLNAGALVTHEGGTPSASAGEFPSSADAVALLSLGLDYLLDDHWTFGANLSGSPFATAVANASFSAPNASGNTDHVNARVQSKTSELTGTVDASYDTAGVSDLEWSFGAAVTFTHLDTDQAITGAHFASSPDKTTTPAELRAACNRGGPRCIPQVLTALGGVPANLDSQKFSANVIATISRDTDLRLSADVYHYDQDPAAVGFFDIANAPYAGVGIPIAPLQFLVRPEVTHRIGDLSLRLWVQAGKYESGTGDNTAGIGARVQYKFTRSFRMWLAVSGQRDTDVDDNATNSAGIALGAGYRW
jgi:hypothetical protein